LQPGSGSLGEAIASAESLSELVLPLTSSGYSRESSTGFHFISDAGNPGKRRSKLYRFSTGLMMKIPQFSAVLGNGRSGLANGWRCDKILTPQGVNRLSLGGSGLLVDLDIAGSNPVIHP
jgi:hypothetical protein